MGARHSGREAALQMLFQIEASEISADKAIELFWRTFEADPEGRAYADSVVRGVEAELEAIDKKITSASQNWRIERMSRVDRNLLRVALYELLHEDETPDPVVIDEAVEIAKKFSTPSSAPFINGVLVGIRRNLFGAREASPRRTRPAPAGSR